MGGVSGETAVNIAFAAVLVGVAVAMVRLCWKPRPAESKQDRFLREECTPGLDVWDDHLNRWISLPPGVKPAPHQYTDREVVSLDELTLAWDAAPFNPADDPQWAAGRERLFDAVRDHTNTPEGDA